MNRFYKNIFWYSFFPLFIGLVLYLCYGSVDTRIYGLFEGVFGVDVLNRLRPNVSLPAFIVFHLPDALWAFSLTGTIFILLSKEIDLRLLLLVSILAVSLYELCQYQNWIGGTPDLIDIGCMIISSLLAFYLINKKQLPCKSYSF